MPYFPLHPSLRRPTSIKQTRFHSVGGCHIFDSSASSDMLSDANTEQMLKIGHACTDTCLKQLMIVTQRSATITW